MFKVEDGFYFLHIRGCSDIAGERIEHQMVLAENCDSLVQNLYIRGQVSAVARRMFNQARHVDLGLRNYIVRGVKIGERTRKDRRGNTGAEEREVSQVRESG